MQQHRLHRSLSVRTLHATAGWCAALGILACFGGCASSDGIEDETSAELAAQTAEQAPTGDANLTDTVTTKGGPINALVLEEAGKKVRVFRGIPYAAAPVGALRWKPPQPAPSWTEPRDGSKWNNRCPQGGSTLSNPGPTGEDCLNLNLLTPATKTTDRLPVMVFFHGGGLSIGTGNSLTYTHTALPAQGVVLITVNSRLGPFGYFSHPALAKESDKNSSGNYGTLDLIASLQWVKDNVAAFGGDPNNVTIFGESGGGTKVLSCMASPLAKGLFHRAVVQSGSGSSSPNGTSSRANAEAAGERVAAQLGVTASDDVLSKLRSKSWEEVLAASAAPGVNYGANLSIDGWVLPTSVNEAFAKGQQANVPLIVGANEGEASSFAASVPGLATLHKSVSSKAYTYNFSFLPAGWRTPGCYAFHGLELTYVFGHVPGGLNQETTKSLGASAGCQTSLDPKASDEDRLVAKNTMALWVQFAKTGDPSIAGLVDWPAYSAETDQYLDINVALNVKKGIATSGKRPGTGATAPTAPTAPAAPTTSAAPSTTPIMPSAPAAPATPATSAR